MIRCYGFFPCVDLSAAGRGVRGRCSEGAPGCSEEPAECPEEQVPREVHQRAGAGWDAPCQEGYRVPLSMSGKRRELAAPAVGHLEQAAP